MKPAPITIETAQAILDFEGGDDSLAGLAKVQLKGVVAIHNMLVDPEIGMGYLADEVGMGKTYIALGVVALMRYFNPMLKVLYICPSRNVQEKWGREYRSFIRHNVRVSQGRIRTRDRKPATPYHSCRNVPELLRVSASGYIADIFIGKDSFSLGMTDEATVWAQKRRELMQLLPAHEWKGIIKSKQEVKEQYAKALNYVLPTFDLVVIDEAHNFKHDFESSDRNNVLSRVLGFRENEGYVPRAKNALLLSATPYDRDLGQLRNQLNLIGKAHLLPADCEGRETIQQSLRRFMVRRLNTLLINDTEHTRNMYRREWRKGPKAEIHLETDEQKLVTALVQKKVGDMLNKGSASPAFQTGLLASFESFAETTKSPPVEFDGDQIERQQTDAKDRHVIGQIVDSYLAQGLGRTLPHPKMDAVVKRLTEEMFESGRKQIVFVRRVKSVKELKDKLDEAYNAWVHRYIDKQLASHEQPRAIMEAIYRLYLKESRTKDVDVSGGENEFDGLAPAEEGNLPPKNDTFYSWFFRGEPHKSALKHLHTEAGDFPTPEAVRNGLAAKNQVISSLLEPNWAWYLCKRQGSDLQSVLEEHGQEIAKRAARFISGRIADDHQEVYSACQLAFIEWHMLHYETGYLRPLFDHLSKGRTVEPTQEISEDRLRDALLTATVYTEIDSAGLAKELIPYQANLFDALNNGQPVDAVLKDFNIHQSLLGFLLRNGHGVIDLYIARLKQGPGNLMAKSRSQWMCDLVSAISRQKATDQFSTFQELSNLAHNLDLIVKNNIPEIHELHVEEYRKFLSQALNPVSPVIGATGETSGRSAQARKFRMPGYPLALISTDVFQEGEDLHTFCGSVVHYGLSGSPVAIEQKTGRVDRVNSYTQRRLLALNGEQLVDDDYIQVTFPHVKESIELLQVKQLCENINQYILSLHEIGDVSREGEDMVALDQLGGPIEIPDQIMSRLNSPYDPEVPSSDDMSLPREIESADQDIQRIYQTSSSLVRERCKIKDAEGGKYQFIEAKDKEVDSDQTLVYLTSAKSSGETILSLTRAGDPDTYVAGAKHELLELMHRISWKTFHRTFAIEESGTRNAYRLYFNAEMLIGGVRGASSDAIDMLLERMETTHDPSAYRCELSAGTIELIEALKSVPSIEVDRFGGTRLSIEKDGEVHVIVFDFGASTIHRTQRVSIYESAGRCIFLSQATPNGFCRQLTSRELLYYTWQRNRRIDLVEFVVNGDDAIMGRAVYPITGMQQEEFVYCAYTLAVEVDRLEYVLDQRDIF